MAEKHSGSGVEHGSLEDQADEKMRAVIRRNRMLYAADRLAMERWAASGFTSAPLEREMYEDE